MAQAAIPIAASVAGGVASAAMSKGGGSSGSQTVVQSNEPWSEAQPFLKQLYQNAQNIPLQQAYPWQTYPTRSPLTDASQLAQVQYATNALPAYWQSGNAALGSMLGAPDVATNQYVNRMLESQAGQITDQLQRQWLPSIRQGASTAGQFGGTAQKKLEGLAIGEAAKALSSAAAQTQLGAYGQGLDQQSRAMAFLPQMAQLGMLPSQVYGQVGGAQEGYNQQIINDALNRWNYTQQAPYTRLAAQTAAIGGIPMNSTQTTTGTTASSPFATGLGTAMSLYSLGNQTGLWNSLGGLFGPSAAAPTMGMGGYTYQLPVGNSFVGF